MFKPGESGCGSRVLIASGDAEFRRHIGNVARVAEMRAIGFIREPEQLIARTLLSMPDVLLLDADMVRLVRLAELHSTGTIRIVVCGSSFNMQQMQQWKREGVHGTLDLAGSGPSNIDTYVRQLRKVLGHDAPPAPPRVAAPPPPPPAVSDVRRKTLPPISVMIGSSTGGPMALMTLLKGLPADFPLPIAVVQHMPPGFTRMLAERLHAECAIRVVEAEAGMNFSAGTVYVAPGGVHMVLSGSAKSPRIELNEQQPENSCRPAVDVLFRSSAAVYGGRQHTIVLTGMGRDGLIGATQLHALGSRIVVQDAATSTVWGMPGAIAQAGYADDILPLDQIAPQLMRCL